MIPFTKPRAIAELAAADPNAIAMEPRTPTKPHAQLDPGYRIPGAPQSPKPATRPAAGAPPVAAPSNTQIPISGWSTIHPPGGSAPAATAARHQPVMPVASAPPARTVAPPAAAVRTAAPAPAAMQATAAAVRTAGPAAGAAHATAAALAPAYAPAPIAPAPVAAPPAPLAPAPMFAPSRPSAPQLVSVPLQPVTPTALGGAPANAPLAPVELPMFPTPAPAVTATPAVESRWAHYLPIGLGPPKLPITSQQAAKWLVSGYRLLGFSILTIIVVVLVGYITTTAFFYVSSSWVVPMAITENDEKVLMLQAQVSEQQGERDRIADELAQAERAIAAQQTFQAEFAKAIKGDLENRKLALGRMRALASAAAGTRASIRSQNKAFAGAARKRMAEEYRAGLIDRNSMLNGKFQLAQISSSNLSLAERQAEYETRAAELEATARSLDAIIANAEHTGDAGLSYEVLQIKQQYEASRLELAKATETRDTLKASLERQEKILAGLKGSAYIRAINDQASVAFVPYGNLSGVEKGEPIYACKLTFMFCYQVGEVLEVIPGEVQFRHPHRDKNLRGQLVEVKFEEDELDAGMEEHLFVGGRPFLL
ncbi:MAG: hypothetical protein AB7R00_08645 [Kofleriaceae bacterium]